MSAIKKLSSERIVAFHVAYAKLPGSDPMCALFLSQVSYWCAMKDDGVAWITHQSMYEQTGMSRKQQDRAAAYWVAQGVLEKFIKGIPPKIHYFVDFDRLEKLLLEAEFQQNDVSERDNLDVPKAHHVVSERGKSSRIDSLDSSKTHTLALLAGVEEQQPEGASGQSTAPSQSRASALPPAQQPASPVSLVKPRARGKFVPPTDEEWLDYCKVTYPTWKRSAALSALAHYQSVEWKGKSDWKACAKTCFHRARPWDLQEPVAQRKTMTPLERQKFEEEQAKNYVPML